jgi:hypothetical protein
VSLGVDGTGAGFCPKANFVETFVLPPDRRQGCD